MDVVTTESVAQIELICWKLCYVAASRPVVIRQFIQRCRSSRRAYLNCVRYSEHIRSVPATSVILRYDFTILQLAQHFLILVLNLVTMPIGFGPDSIFLLRIGFAGLPATIVLGLTS